MTSLPSVAHARLGLHDHDQAVALLRRASQYLPRDPPILANLAPANEQKRNLRPTVLDYQESNRHWPDNSQVSAGLTRMMAAEAGLAGVR